MLAAYNLDGAALPPKTLCLTFDDGPGDTTGDGPGPKTVRLAEYLASEGLHVTFFFTGRHIGQYPEEAKQVLQLGHTIGNHTYNHPDFLKPNSFEGGETMITEIEKTQALISSFYTNKNIYFRAPYGSWSQEVADTLNSQLNSDVNYIGPIGWDINENDWLYWLNSLSPEECAEAYLQSIEKAGKGIVIMHDSTTDNETMRLNNRTFETVKILVPRLRSLGYRFVQLHEVPGIPAAQ